MKAANNPNILLKYTLALAVMVMALLVTGCTLDGVSDEPMQGEVTEADLEAASQILGESLSDENSGVMASINDALTTVSSSGLEKQKAIPTSENPSLQTHDDDTNTGRGEEINFSYNYSSATGTHTITFERMVHNSDYFKSVRDTLKYIFTDNSGQYIAFPRENSDRIETIDFKGYRDGLIESLTRESQFVRRDTFFIDGVSAASPILSIDGVHYGRGQLSSQNDAGQPFQKRYNTKISFLDIQIDKAIVQEIQSLEQGVTGTLSWEMVITNTTNGSSETKTITGTVEMNGDGTALLRFEGFKKLFLINLDDGHVRDHDSEFEGRVKHVDINAGSFTLASGRTIYIADRTEIAAESDVASLEGVVHALENGSFVDAEGTGSADGDRFIASRVLFEVSQGDERHFEGYVDEVDLQNRIVRFNTDDLIRFGEESIISEGGDLYNLEQVVDALQQGNRVKVNGYGRADDASDAHLLVLEAKFLLEAPDHESFEGHITAVNLDAGTFTLNQELVIRIGDASIVSESGNLYTLQEAADALAAGVDVIAYGSGKVDNDTASHLLAIEVVFKAQVEDFEGTVTAVNLDAGTFTLGNEWVVRIGEETIISESGEYLTLQAVSDALAQNQPVIGFGDGIYDRATDARLLAFEVRFEPGQ